MEQRYRWKNKQLREHVQVLNGELSPSLLLKNATYLHSTLKKWVQGHIWIYQDRIVYTGEKLPENLGHCEVVDCAGQYLVPGYIEPHVHPFQLYNPQSFSKYASQSGTTTFVNDNLMMFLQLEKKKAFTLLSELNELPVSMYWWTRFDSQTEMMNEEVTFSNGEVKSWLEHDSVLQGGELTAWPRLLQGDDLLLHWMQEAKRMGKVIEGHLPGASDKTIAKLRLLGIDGDHEAMSGEDVYKRLIQGLTVTLRHSSIRPDLPVLLEGLKEQGIDSYDSLLFTTDGSTPGFYEQGVLDFMIKMAIEKGVPLIDAYNMASYNVANYYNITHLHGMIATGRVANINFLSAQDEPTPVSVLAKGKWVRLAGEQVEDTTTINWGENGFKPLDLDWEVGYDDLQFSMPFGIEMVNDVITKPYSISINPSTDFLDGDHDQSFLMLLDRKGEWRISTMIKGFAGGVMGFASSYSNTGDIILIGKSKPDMIAAFRRMKEIGGGIVLTENGEVLHEIPLPLSGLLSQKDMPELIEEEKVLKSLLKERGYRFADPIYTLLFLQSTHLPYIRMTQKGIYDVMKKTVLFPTIMR
ncbi:adenine deaminase C-terminal domain-containing protein [Bacillus sp. KH172YL63]|uniref:adenine deaminase C-terminal domain-containing protein n=1 Tax=Bacillus sp. KH172YL63 TaxID=2709784 RepID=UPI0013E419E1|nr:adenine deaminase C-terminal domain-containing protein [Bacillus sp. KH172YL63]BCB02207.1 putative adenine deaminase [Bacillus sp. KH172YL63]